MLKTALFAALAFAAPTLTGCHRGRHDPAKVAEYVREHIDDALDSLDATDAQKGRIQASVKKVTDQIPQLVQDHKKVRDEFVQQLDSANPDSARLHVLVDQRADAYRAVAHQAVDAMLETHATLTPEQRAKVSKKIHKHLEWSSRW